MKLGDRLLHDDAVGRRGHVAHGLPPRGTRSVVLVVEGEIEPLDHAARDGPAALGQVFERDRRRSSVGRRPVPPRGIARVDRGRRCPGVLADVRRRREQGRAGVGVVFRDDLRLPRPAHEPGLELQPLLAGGKALVERRAVGDVDAVRVGQGSIEVWSLRELEPRVIEVEGRVLAADEAARDELVPAVGAVRLLVGLGNDEDLLAVAHVPEADGVPIGVRVLVARPFHLAHDGRRQDGRAEPRTIGRPGIDRGCRRRGRRGPGRSAACARDRRRGRRHARGLAPLTVLAAGPGPKRERGDQKRERAGHGTLPRS